MVSNVSLTGEGVSLVPLTAPTQGVNIVTDGTTTVGSATEITFAGNLVVSDGGAGNVVVTPSGVAQARVVLSSAQIKAMDVSPVTIVAAPGAGKMIKLLSAVYSLTFVSAAYSGGSAPGLYFTNGSGFAVDISAQLTLLLAAGASRVVSNSSAVAIPVTATTALANKALVMTDTAPWITGSGTLAIIVDYAVVDL